MMEYRAKFNIGQVVSHRLFGFRGVIYDVDPQYANTEAWYEAIPKEIRPHKDQPFYHLLAQNETGSYEAYVSEQNLVIRKKIRCRWSTPASWITSKRRSPWPLPAAQHAERTRSLILWGQSTRTGAPRYSPRLSADPHCLRL